MKPITIQELRDNHNLKMQYYYSVPHISEQYLKKQYIVRSDKTKAMNYDKTKKGKNNNNNTVLECRV